jgi:uroporphyrinogen III methyltransferase / synthase
VTVYLVGAGPGDPGLLTRRGADLLARADVVVYDRLIDPALLSLARSDAVLVDAGKRPAGSAGGGVAGGAARQDEINALLVAHGRAGRTVVRLKGGDPFLFGRGGEEAEALTRAAVAWEVVPGVTSATAVPAYAGIPVTHRGLSSSVTVVTGHVGDPSAPGGVDWESLARAGGTLVILMGMATRAEIARRLQAGGRPADTPVAVVQWGTTPSQRSVRTTLEGLESVTLGSPSVVVVGPVAALDLAWFAERPLAGTTVVVTRAREQAGTLAGAFDAAGARVVEVPVVEIADPEDGGVALRGAAAGVAGYDWVAFTSANSVHRFVPLLRDGRSLGSASLAAVGGATAGALAGYHVVADLVAGG